MERLSRSRGFTLIELLVVISIIGLLSSVVVASLNSARQKARIGAARQFSAQVERVAGEMVVGAWNFDECTGSSTVDITGYGANGTFGTGVSWSGDTPTGKGCSLSFDGINGRVTVPYHQELDPDRSFTLSTWIKIDELPSIHAGIISKNNYSQYLLRINAPSESNRVAFFIRDEVTLEPRASTPFPAPVGEWFHVVATYNADGGGGNISLYYNGTQKFSATRTGAPVPSATPIYFGYGASGYFKGYLDDVRIYSKGLTAFEVDELYAAEMQAHTIVSNTE